MISFPSREHHIAAVYDACCLLIDTYETTDLLDVYEDNNLPDMKNTVATCKEILALIAEGSLYKK